MLTPLPNSAVIQAINVNMLGDQRSLRCLMPGGKSMSLRFMKEHLPWMIPTVAIVLAAMGVIDFNPRESETTASADFETTAVSRNMTQSPVDLGQQSNGIAPLISGGAPAVPAAVIQPQEAPAPAVAATQQTMLVQPAVVAPTPAPIVPQKVSVAKDDPINPTELFGAAQARLAQDNSCVEDLRVLTQNAHIYFPSGGLTGEDTGLAQARLIGLVAQDCKAVEIIVEGHSDPSGDPDANLKLSQQRADAVLQRIAAAGIDVTRFRAVGIGSAEPSGINGAESSAYYDRRVEFEVREITPVATPVKLSQQPMSDCALELQAAVEQTKLFFSPRSITPPSDGLPAVIKLAAAASECPDARLRVIGHYSDEVGSGETPATARLRAVALMSSLVGTGFAPDKIIIAAHSRPTVLAGQPGLSKRRIDFDVIMDN
jgi:outer membrane protein OmpA-like peptidoglycan-associated protein